MSASPLSIFSARMMLVHMKTMAMVNGKPQTMDTAWSALRPLVPVPPTSPALSRAMHTAPSVQHQKIFWMTGGSMRPPAEMMSSTYEPLSLEVTKYSTMPTSIVTQMSFVTSL